MNGIFDKLNSDEAGILLYVENENLSYKIVYGSDRPKLMCSTFRGETVMMRPYMEDFWKRSAKEILTLDEKVELAENGDTDIMQELA